MSLVMISELLGSSDLLYFSISKFSSTIIMSYSTDAFVHYNCIMNVGETIEIGGQIYLLIENFKALYINAFLVPFRCTCILPFFLVKSSSPFLKFVVYISIHLLCEIKMGQSSCGSCNYNQKF